MFGLSLTKILFTAGIIVAVWRGWKLMEFFRDKIADDPGEEDAKSRKQARRRKRSPGRAWFKRSASPPAPPVDLVACPDCGTYVAADLMFEHARICPKDRH